VDDALLKMQVAQLEIGSLRIQPFWMRSLCVASGVRWMTCSTIASDTYDVSLAHDTYNGPLSAEAGALVEYVKRSSSPNFSQFNCGDAGSGTQPEVSTFASSFESQRLADQVRVDSWQTSILSSRDTGGKWKDFLQLRCQSTVSSQPYGENYSSAIRDYRTTL
jgi:hypothetical protein